MNWWSIVKHSRRSVDDLILTLDGLKWILQWLWLHKETVGMWFLICKWMDIWNNVRERERGGVFLGCCQIHSLFWIMTLSLIHFLVSHLSLEVVRVFEVFSTFNFMAVVRSRAVPFYALKLEKVRPSSFKTPRWRLTLVSGREREDCYAKKHGRRRSQKVARISPELDSSSSVNEFVWSSNSVSLFWFMKLSPRGFFP
jgi:hypothetical protein